MTRPAKKRAVKTKDKVWAKAKVDELIGIAILVVAPALADNVAALHAMKAELEKRNAPR